MNTTPFYNTIEVEYKVFNYHPNYHDLENLSEQKRLELSYEYMAMHNFEADILKDRINNEKDAISKYLLTRIERSSNSHLLARYYHFLK